MFEPFDDYIKKAAISQHKRWLERHRVYNLNHREILRENKIKLRYIAGEREAMGIPFVVDLAELSLLLGTTKAQVGRAIMALKPYWKERGIWSRILYELGDQSAKEIEEAPDKGKEV